ncbi:hypothetical protein BJ085DRAFT_32629 [Dimargaris cristalligena]|uniref:Uncharacterized protein n=1 Tax=Dimargaris cristalligena TaxID=215637 RepID=A0A4P9ZRW1_9FUNG|nr:hypothetical protein BJ085DRAFT_32629 [Dimargaris cristalligena]|eukprot:RKP35392.1 hypothetical protein BJ085DRAFT_32629 [Dimargaris cristalligena]
MPQHFTSTANTPGSSPNATLENYPDSPPPRAQSRPAQPLSVCQTVKYEPPTPITAFTPTDSSHAPLTDFTATPLPGCGSNHTPSAAKIPSPGPPNASQRTNPVVHPVAKGPTTTTHLHHHRQTSPHSLEPVAKRRRLQTQTTHTPTLPVSLTQSPSPTTPTAPIPRSPQAILVSLRDTLRSQAALLTAFDTAELPANLHQQLTELATDIDNFLTGNPTATSRPSPPLRSTNTRPTPVDLALRLLLPPTAEGFAFTFLHSSKTRGSRVLRQSLSTLGVDTKRIIDVSTPGHKICAILTHRAYTSDLRRILAEKGISRIHINPLNPAHLHDPMIRSMSERQQRLEAIRLWSDHLQDIVRRNPVRLATPLIDYFSGEGWISSEDMETLRREIPNRRHQESSGRLRGNSTLLTPVASPPRPPTA